MYSRSIYLTLLGFGYWFRCGSLRTMNCCNFVHSPKWISLEFINIHFPKENIPFEANKKKNERKNTKGSRAILIFFLYSSQLLAIIFKHNIINASTFRLNSIHLKDKTHIIFEICIVWRWLDSLALCVSHTHKHFPVNENNCKRLCNYKYRPFKTRYCFE